MSQKTSVAKIFPQPGVAQVIDLAQARADRERDCSEAEAAAAQALADFRTGHGSFDDLRRALVAPFNDEPVVHDA